MKTPKEEAIEKANAKLKKAKKAKANAHNKIQIDMAERAIEKAQKSIEKANNMTDHKWTSHATGMTLDLDLPYYKDDLLYLKYILYKLELQ